MRWILSLFAAFGCLGIGIAAEKPLFYDRAVGLYFGIDDYGPNSSWKKSVGCAQDATSLSQVLQTRYGYEVGAKLLNRDASRENILTAIKGTLPKLGRNDVLVIFLAMHGYVEDFGPKGGPENRRGYFIPYGCSIDPDAKTNTQETWDREALPMRLILDLTRSKDVQAKHILIIADTCCSSYLTSRGRLYSDASLRSVMTSSSRRVISSVGHEQTTAFGRPEGGLFTSELVKQLEKAADASSVMDLYLAVRKEVIASTNGKMKPLCEAYAPSDGELVFLPKTRQVEQDLAGIKSFLNRLNDPNTPRGVVPRGLERIQARLQLRTTIADVIEAFQADDYRSTSDPGNREIYWKAKLEKFEENAALDQPLAMLGLVYCYAKGLGTEPNPRTAFFWAKLAFSTGDPSGKHALGKCYYEGLGCEPNRVASDNYINQAAEDHFPISLYSRGITFWFNNEKEKAKADWQAASQAGVSLATVESCAFTLEQQITKPDELQTLIKRLTPARNQKVSRACYYTADCYHRLAGLVGQGRKLKEADGKEIKKYQEECLKALTEAADQGNADAQYTLARELLPTANSWEFDIRRWLELKPDSQRAENYASLAIKRKHPLAQLLVASLYLRSNPTKAAELMAEPLKAGLTGALVMKAGCYITGHGGVKKDYASAVALLDQVFKKDKNHFGMHNWWAILFIDAANGMIDEADHRILTQELRQIDFVMNKPIFRHYALSHAIKAARQTQFRTSSDDIVETIAKEIKMNPKAVFWEYFKRDFADLIPDLNKLSGENLRP